MKSTPSVLALSLALLSPAVALGQEVTVTLSGETLPVGPAGTRVMHVDRYRVGDAHYAVLRVRSPRDASRCGVNPERIITWGQFDHHWVEMQNDVYDRCPTDGARRVSRSIRAFVMESTQPSVEPQFDLGVQTIDPRQPITEAPVVRYHLVGQRLLRGHLDTPLAANAAAPVAHVLGENTLAAVDGALTEWSAPALLTSNDHGRIWAAMRGTTLHIAARTEAPADAPASLTVWLAEPGVSTAVMTGTRDNAGRELRVECAPDGSTTHAGAGEFVCHREGTLLSIEGSTDLGTMIWRSRNVSEVSMLATVRVPRHHALHSEAGMHLERLGLPETFDLARGASGDMLQPCEGGFMGRVAADPQSPGLGTLLTCGQRCENGRCESQLGLEGTGTRMLWENTPRYAEGCLDLLGPGRDVFHSCQGPNQTRLVGQIPVRGFEAVLVVERTQTQHQERRAEVWALVTPSAHWQRLWEGHTLPLSAPTASSVQIDGEHARVCRGGSTPSCERIDTVTLSHTEDSVTGDIVHALRVAGVAMN